MRWISTLVACWWMFPACVVSAAPPEQNDPAFLWDLGDLYGSPQAWSTEYASISSQTGQIDRHQITIGQSAGDMLNALSAVSDIHKSVSRLRTYATLKADENVKDGPNQERAQAAQILGNTFREKTAWLRPQILALGAEKIHAFEQQNAELKRRFGFYLDNVLRYAPHSLSAEAEGIIAAARTPLGQPGHIYSQLSDGELPFPSVTLADGSSVRLNAAAYEKNRQNSNRAERKKVFDAFWGTYGGFQGTFGATLAAHVLGEEFDARMRHFPDALGAALFDDDMPESVYRMLLAEADKNLPVLHRYLRLRKRALAIEDDLQYYDMYPPMFEPQTEPHYTIEESKKIALDVTAVYGPEYTTRLQRGFAARWMNVYPHPGKASGGYMNPGAYDVHPYLLFNSADDYYSLSIFVHEWGHAVHTLLTHDAQPFDTADYSTFTAETASITNELLLDDYMVGHAKTDSERLYFLGEELELIRSTFFRQTMFAKFQLAIHEETEKGGTLSGERMTNLYCGMLKEYYGDAQNVMKIDPAYCVEWAFIPHFYYGFYVYQYATSMAGAAEFAEALEKKQPGAQARFISMLKAGGSDYPYKLYLHAGLDMASPAPYEALMARMTHLMDRIEALQKKSPHSGPAAKN